MISKEFYPVNSRRRIGKDTAPTGIPARITDRVRVWVRTFYSERYPGCKLN